MLVIAPSGAGKTIYVQQHKGWIDGDDVIRDSIQGGWTARDTVSPTEWARMEAAAIQPLANTANVMFNPADPELYTGDVRVVIPEERVHRAQFETRQRYNQRAFDFESVLKHREALTTMAQRRGWPVHSSFAAAVRPTEVSDAVDADPEETEPQEAR